MSNVEDKYACHKGKNPLSNEIAILKVVDALKMLIELSRLQSGSLLTSSRVPRHFVCSDASRKVSRSVLCLKVKS